jgi:hypothetical protein
VIESTVLAWMIMMVIGLMVIGSIGIPCSTELTVLGSVTASIARAQRNAGTVLLQYFSFSTPSPKARGLQHVLQF